MGNNMKNVIYQYTWNFTTVTVVLENSILVYQEPVFTFLT